MAETPDLTGQSEDLTPSESTPADRDVSGAIILGAPSEAPPEGEAWVTVREASEQAGVSRSSIRKWYGNGVIQSRLEPGPTGDQRMVLLSEITARVTRRQAQQTGPTTPTGSTGDAAPPGTMLVPLEAWQGILNQLGNLHESGQRLAEEAAGRAKAETEAQFLRERNAELRKQLEEARESLAPAISDDLGEKVAPDMPTLEELVKAMWDKDGRSGPMEGLDYPMGGQPGDPMPDETEKAISEVVEEAAARRPWWVRAIRRRG